MEAGRKTSCWACKYLITADPATDAGHCVRRAPDKAADYYGKQIEGTAVITALFPFRTINPATESFCGDFARMEGDIPTAP